MPYFFTASLEKCVVALSEDFRERVPGVLYRPLAAAISCSAAKQITDDKLSSCSADRTAGANILMLASPKHRTGKREIS